MTHIQRLSIVSIFLVLMTGIMSFKFKPVTSPFEVNFHSQSLNISISGTSSLHDWEMKSDKGRCEVILQIDNASKLTGISKLNFTLPAESLKSGHGTMDNNTYKALKTDNYKSIEFKYSSAKISQINPANYQLSVNGKLSIAGSVRETEILATVRYNAEDKSYTVTGKKDLRMTDYNVKPPTVMFGTIKTGNDISISFTSKIIQK